MSIPSSTLVQQKTTLLNIAAAPLKWDGILVAAFLVVVGAILITSGIEIPKVHNISFCFDFCYCFLITRVEITKKVSNFKLC